jgi:hypothetical protein
MVWPSYTWIGWTLIAVAAVGSLALGCHHVVGWSLSRAGKRITGVAVPSACKPVLPDGASAVIPLSNLYDLTETGAIRLRLIPYSRSDGEAFLLLILLGYSELRGAKTVKAQVATNAMNDSGFQTPMEKLMPLQILQRPNSLEIARNIPSLVEIARMADGGLLSLTDAGHERATALAKEIAERA